ncbi:hypothetical protein [Saccharothrix variisporea]|uniref:Uncharacterized protein n=1 Tax=Saccharothrix variisporea TaxID=543527 RepID=A0A495XHN0_9PSEU|nr:hypothetical protein [Saccharothrix variisporea]RKT73522.1 hypothetical protein DFJ66_6859 [Saccharothrix variisporea]
MSRRGTGVVLLFVAGITAAVATFLPLCFVGTALGGDDRFGFTMTSWATTSEPAGLVWLGGSAQYGVPVVIAAVLLVVAAALVFLPEPQRQAARYTAVAATALLAGAVWTTVMAVAAWLTPPVTDVRTSIEYETGAGVWVLVASVVVAVVGTVFLLRRSEPVAEAPVVRVLVDPDTDTPPLGIQVAVLPELPEKGVS